MSAIRATGMYVATAFCPCRSRGTPTCGAGSPIPATEPYPWPNPPPGSTIWPSMAASTTPSHSGCSPCRARCSDQLTVTMVREAAISCASSLIRVAGTPVIAEAHPDP